MFFGVSSDFTSSRRRATIRTRLQTDAGNSGIVFGGEFKNGSLPFFDRSGLAAHVSNSCKWTAPRLLSGRFTLGLVTGVTVPEHCGSIVESDTVNLNWPM
jgi:hypothetical protein